MNFRSHFEDVVREVRAQARGPEVVLANYYGEHSDFLRFNRSAVRQPGSVMDIELTVDMIVGQKRASCATRLTGHMGEDAGRIAAAVRDAREGVSIAPDDPFIHINRTATSSSHVANARLPSRAEAVEAIEAAGRGRDMVGIYAAGRQAIGFANTLGQTNWHEADSFNLDWCFYRAADKAVKSNYAGFEWNPAELARIVGEAGQTLELLARPGKTVPPGAYRAYFTPSAIAEIWGWLAWGGFGLQSHKTRSTAFLRSIDGVDRFDARVSLTENTAKGVAPGFQQDGFLKPAHVDLIAEGHYCDCMISPRSAVEYGAQTNGANESEQPQSLDMAAGSLARADALKALGTGVYVSNLWYLNYSDRNNGRLTGLTRFATMWVESGEIVAPLNVMRFDDSIYRIFGSALEDLTVERDMILDTGTYGRRSVDSMRLPGALVSDFDLTL